MNQKTLNEFIKDLSKDDLLTRKQWTELTDKCLIHSNMGISIQEHISIFLDIVCRRLSVRSVCELVFIWVGSKLKDEKGDEN